MASDCVLEVTDLEISVRKNPDWLALVKGISFRINQGETLALVGESGSGKSLTALSIMGLLTQSDIKITHGTVVLHSKSGKPVALHASTEEALNLYRGLELGMIFQEPLSALNPSLTCGFQLYDVFRRRLRFNHQQARDASLSLLKEVLLPDPESVFNRYPHELSGGQKQRIMIALAIAGRPSILIADEPTTALDPTVQKEILDLLKSLQKSRGMSILIITHDLPMVAEFANRVMVLRRGECVETGTIQSVFANPQHAYTKALLLCRPPLSGKPKRLPVLQDFLKDASTNHDSIKESLGVLSLNRLKAEIQVLNLSVKIPKKKSGFSFHKAFKYLVNYVSFSLFPGETLGLIGESGCGKSTLARTLLQLMPASGGTIIYKSISDYRTEHFNALPSRKFMQLVFQDPFASLNPLMSVGEAIAEAIAQHRIETHSKKIKALTEQWLEAVGLQAAHYTRLPHEFSGGQRQRVSIARALCVNPSVLVCDESVSALDLSIQAQILNLINDLKNTLGFSCLFISHDLNVVRYMCERVMVMKSGAIIESGTSDEVLRNPRQDYTRQLLQAVPKFEFK